jgi:stalled ribosome rescue protein Dom34
VSTVTLSKVPEKSSRPIRQRLYLHYPLQGAPFFREVARALDGIDAVLIVGPSSAKLEFLKYVQDHDRKLQTKVAGIETVDYPTDREIVAYAKRYFKGSDRM